MVRATSVMMMAMVAAACVAVVCGETRIEKESWNVVPVRPFQLRGSVIDNTNTSASLW